MRPKSLGQVYNRLTDLSDNQSIRRPRLGIPQKLSLDASRSPSNLASLDVENWLKDEQPVSASVALLIGESTLPQPIDLDITEAVQFWLEVARELRPQPFPIRFLALTWCALVLLFDVMVLKILQMLKIH
jgi:hypothetical protein